MTSRVILLHGLWVPAASMRWLGAQLQRGGFFSEYFGYSSVAAGPEATTPALAERIGDAPCHLVAHSLGGLVALAALEKMPELPVDRLVCLGSPLCGSAAAAGLVRNALTANMLGRSGDLLRAGCMPWNGRAQVGMVAGNSPVGLGQFFGAMRGENDGTVAVEETRLPGLADHVVVAASHSGLLVSTPAANQTLAFLREGHFEH